MPPEDRSDLQEFIRELLRLLLDATNAERHPDLLSFARRAELRATVEQNGQVFIQVINALDNPAIETSPVGPGTASLTDANLIGSTREGKVSGWRRAFERFLSFPTRRTLDRAYRWANMLLESLVAVVPQAAVLKELKQYAENLNKDAIEDAADAGKGPV
jgi:hypothetical protein